VQENCCSVSNNAIDRVRGDETFVSQSGTQVLPKGTRLAETVAYYN
jgi:CRISPR/Cas system CSM-associated protein Csm3 (group 7 of RAMP superfamily)